MIYTCPNGELVDTESGLIIGYSDFEEFPPLSQDAQSILRHFDGMNMGELGSIPKIIALGRDEERLLRRLHPYKFFKMGVRSDYLRMVDKINKKRMSSYISVRMKNAWADPTSIRNSPEYRLNLAEAIRAGQSTPQAKLNMSLGQIRRFARPKERVKVSLSALKKFRDQPELKRNISDKITALWEDESFRQRTIAGMLTQRRTSKHRENMRNAQSHDSRVAGAKKAWITRRKRHGPTGRKQNI